MIPFWACFVFNTVDFFFFFENVGSNFVYNNQKLDTIQMSINRGIDSPIEMYAYNYPSAITGINYWYVQQHG